MRKVIVQQSLKAPKAEGGPVAVRIGVCSLPKPDRDMGWRWCLCNVRTCAVVCTTCPFDSRWLRAVTSDTTSNIHDGMRLSSNTPHRTISPPKAIFKQGGSSFPQTSRLLPHAASHDTHAIQFLQALRPWPWRVDRAERPRVRLLVRASTRFL